MWGVPTTHACHHDSTDRSCEQELTSPPAHHNLPTTLDRNPLKLLPKVSPFFLVSAPCLDPGDSKVANAQAEVRSTLKLGGGGVGSLTVEEQLSRDPDMGNHVTT